MIKLLAASAATIVLTSSAPVVFVSMSDAPDLELAAAEQAVAPEPAADDDGADRDGGARDHGGVPGGADALAERPAVSLYPEVEVVGASPEQLVAVDDALDRFRGAELMLPDVEIVFLDEQEACKGHHGLFQAQYTPWRLLVCSDLAFVLTHELAHAWEAANLDDADRRRYVELRGLPTWNSADDEWGERGIEDVAVVLQQNLMARRVNAGSDRWAEWTAAYEALTGQVSPVLTAA